MTQKRVAAHTLGCKVNQCDTEALLTRLVGMGFAVVAFSEVADIYIINTCTVTHVSDRKSRQMIRRARKLNPEAFVAVCGCMAKNDPAIAREIGADYIFDAREPESLIGKIDRFDDNGKSLILFPNHQVKFFHTRAFIKIQDGCDRFCSYCIVPHVRGAPQSRPMAEILAEAENFIKNSTLEIVLTGIQVASYGDDTEEANLATLIKYVAALDGLKRLRLSSIDPWAVNSAFLDAVDSSPALCSHFHLSLQSGCTTTLTRMNRRYTTEEYAKAAKALRELRPDAALTTDVIVGFPGESHENFQDSLKFVQDMKFAKVHVFEYSPRAGTPAAEFPLQVPSQVKSERGKIMRELTAKTQARFLKKQIGKTMPVLFESTQKGHTENYCPVEVASTSPNTIQNVKITGATGELLIGTI